MNRQLSACLCMLGLLFACGVVYGDEYILPPKPLSEIVAISSTVVVASLTEVPTMPPKAKPVERGVVRLKTQYTLKGDCTGSFDLDVVQAWVQYIHSYPKMFHIGSEFVLLMNKKSDGVWKPAHDLYALLPIATGTKAISRDNKDVLRSVVRLLLTGISNPDYRKITLRELYDTVDPDIEPVMMRFVNDSNLSERDQILRLLGANHVWRVIPLIADLQHQLMQKTGFSAASLSIIRNCKSHEAIRFMNPLVLDTDGYIRINAIVCLAEIADNTSIPYLVKCLDTNDNPDRFIHFQAYKTLHRLKPDLVQAVEYRYFVDHEKEKIRSVKDALKQFETR